MSDSDLAQLIDELRTAVDASSSLSDDDRVRLAALVARVEAAAEEEEEEEEDESLLEQLDDAVSRFEAEHLGVVTTIGRIANALSAGGI